MWPGNAELSWGSVSVTQPIVELTFEDSGYGEVKYPSKDVRPIF